MKIVVAMAAAAALAACAPSPAPVADGRTSAPAGSGDTAVPARVESDTARIARLEREARAIAHTGGCTAGQCRAAPVGSRPCGGPRTYLVYCAATTDSAALFAKLAELARAEDEHNRRNQLASTCEYRMPPAVGLSGGRCAATQTSEPGPQ